MNGNFIKEYESTRDAERQTGISRRNIEPPVQEYFPCLGSMEPTLQASSPGAVLLSPGLLAKSRNKNYGKHSQKPVNLYDLAGNFIAKFDSVIKLANYLNVYDTAVCNACKNGAITCKKFRCEYA